MVLLRVRNSRASELKHHLFIILQTVVTEQGTLLAKLIERVTSNPIRCNWTLIGGPSEITTAVFSRYHLLAQLNTLILHARCHWLILAGVLQPVNILVTILRLLHNPITSRMAPSYHAANCMTTHSHGRVCVRA